VAAWEIRFRRFGGWETSGREMRKNSQMGFSGRKYGCFPTPLGFMIISQNSKYSKTASEPMLK
jgi:hypothetical protein